jgi:predicted DsbA family dithiol-disulfide isomerase
MTISIDYFTDVLCIWAYSGQIRIDELQHNLGDDIHLRYHFVPLFAAARQRVDEQWGDKGGLEAFNRNLHSVASQWDHVSLHPDVWLKDTPASSSGAHLMLKAVQLLQDRGEIDAGPVADLGGRTCFEEYLWRIRLAFFHNCENVGRRSVLERIAVELGLPVASIRSVVDNGEACAAIYLDDQARQKYQVPGSPTLVLNDGRQLLYGNVGYRIIEANVRELIQNPLHGEASWC